MICPAPLERTPGIEQQVDVGGDRARLVHEEPEGIAAGPSAAHVRAQERRGVSLLLGVPGRAATGQVTGRDALLPALLEVGPEARMAVAEHVFG